MAGTDMKALASRGREFAGRLSPLQKIALGAVTLTLVAGAFVLTRSSGTPAMSALYTDLSGSDASSVVDELTTRGVQYQLTDAGHTILVPKDQVYDLRVDLAGKGLPATNEGYALLDDQGITTSEFRQRIDYQRALEGELAKTLLAMDNIASASVHLALPEESVFVDQPADPTASVMVDASGTGGIDDDQVQAIIHLVSSSVKGMQPEDVTVIDANGAVLSAPGVTGSATGGTAKAKAEAAYEQKVAANITAAIARVTGADKVAVSVVATLDLDETQATSEDYGSRTVDTTGTSTGSEKVSENCAAEVYGEGVGTAGSTGVLGPDGAVVAPTVPSTIAAGGYQSANCDTAYAVDRTVTETVSAPGKVENLSIAILVDESAITEEQKSKITDIAKAAGGFQEVRGDTISVERMKFDTSAADEATKAAATETAAAAQQRTMELIRTLAVAFVILIAVILAYRSTRKARKITATPIDIGEIRSGSAGHGGDGDVLTPELASVPGAGTLGDGNGRLNSLALAMESKHEGPIAEIQEIAETRPEEVANVLRAWLAESKAGRR